MSTDIHVNIEVKSSIGGWERARQDVHWLERRRLHYARLHQLLSS